MIEHLDVKTGPFEKLIFGKILKGCVPRHGEVGTIDLKDEPGGDDRAVLLTHRLGDGFDISRMAVVILVRQKARDHAGGRGIQKDLVWC